MPDFPPADEQTLVTRSAGCLSSLAELKSIARSEATHRLVDVYSALMAELDPSLPQPSLPQPGLPQPGLPQPGLRQPSLPQKVDFNPMALRNFTTNAVLYDVSDPNHIVFRLVGETIKSHFGINPVGRCYLEFVPGKRRAHAHTAFRHCADQPCAMLSRTLRVFESGSGRYCESLGVPLFGPDPSRPATHLLFVNNPISSENYYCPDETPFNFAHMLERYFVDLGHGVPGHFDDLVLDDKDSPFKVTVAEPASIELR